MEFQWPPGLLSLLAIPLLVALYALAQRRRHAYAVRFTNLALLREVAGPHPGWRRHVPPLLFLAGLAALGVSLARPTAVIGAAHKQSTLILVLDVSGSMATSDLPPTRLDAAKTAMRALIAGLPPETQVGLVSFSDSAQLSAPITTDHVATLSGLALLKPDGGTAIGEGLDLALSVLAQRPRNAKEPPPPATVVLLSDGESNEGAPPLDAASRARRAGVKVFTVGIGRPDTGLDESTLRRMAAVTGGSYFYAAGGDDLKRIYTHLSSSISWRLQRTDVSPLATAIGGAALLAGALLSLFWLRHFP